MGNKSGKMYEPDLKDKGSFLMQDMKKDYGEDVVKHVPYWILTSMPPHRDHLQHRSLQRQNPMKSRIRSQETSHRMKKLGGS
ncbi:hypothetical protein AOLI_G00217640 [Acnodon oligacanthus]